MRRNQAFTLIEVMVVLSVLAIIAILAYNFFGGTMKEATLKQQVTKVYNDLRILDDAYQQYYVKNRVPISNINDLVTSGILKSLPVADSAIGGGNYQYSAGYARYPNHDDGSDTTTTDPAFELGSFAKPELCAAFNEYVGLPATIHDASAVELYPAIYSCVSFSGTLATQYIVGFVEFD